MQSDVTKTLLFTKYNNNDYNDYHNNYNIWSLSVFYFIFTCHMHQTVTEVGVGNFRPKLHADVTDLVANVCKGSTLILDVLVLTPGE